MTQSILAANAATMGISLGFAFVAVMVGAVALRLVDRIVFPTIDFVEEIKKGNMAAAVVSAAAVLFMAMILSTALR